MEHVIQTITGEASQVAQTLRAKLHAFRQHVPLIVALRRPGLKERHWSRISAAVGTQLRIDEHFSLATALKLGLMEHLGVIEEEAERASKEYALERGIERMQVPATRLSIQVWPACALRGRLKSSCVSQGCVLNGGCAYACRQTGWASSCRPRRGAPPVQLCSAARTRCRTCWTTTSCRCVRCVRAPSSSRSRSAARPGRPSCGLCRRACRLHGQDAPTLQRASKLSWWKHITRPITVSLGIDVLVCLV